MVEITEKTSTGIKPNVAGLLCYLVGWITGLIFLLDRKRKQICPLSRHPVYCRLCGFVCDLLNPLVYSCHRLDHQYLPGDCHVRSVDTSHVQSLSWRKIQTAHRG